MKRYLIFLLFSLSVWAQNSGPSLTVFLATPPTRADKDQGPFLSDNKGNLLVNVNAGSAGNSASGPTGAAVPANADYCGINVGGTLRGCTGVNPSGTVYAQQMDITSVNGVTVVAAAAGVQEVGTIDANGCGATKYEQAFAYLPNASTQLTATDTCVKFVWFSNHDNAASHQVTFQDQSTGCNTGVCVIYNTFVLPPLGVEARPLFGAKFTGGLKWNADAANVVIGHVIGNQ
jgi:hypothetical protein